MKKYVSISGISAENPYDKQGVVGWDLFRALTARFPEGVSGFNRDSFEIKLIDSDPRVRQIMDYLKSIGLTPWFDHSIWIKDNEYTYSESYEYELSDYEHAELFTFGPKSSVFGVYRNETVYIYSDEFPPDSDIVTTASRQLVSSGVRGLLEGQKFKGLLFKPVGLLDWRTREPIPWPDDVEAYWQLDSDFVLPPVAPNPDPDNITFQYRRDDLRAAGEFDIARAKEMNGEVPLFIFSRRFYGFCEKEALPINWGIIRVMD